MKILYDYQIFLLQKYGGISSYYCNLFDKLIEQKYNTKIAAPIHISEVLKELKNQNTIIGKKIDRIPRFTTKIITRFNDLFFEYYVQKFKPQIIHYTYYNKLFNFNNVKKIITIYDLIHEKFYNKKNLKKKSLDSIDRIICISKNTQNELIDYYKVDRNKTSVVYLASKFYYNKSELIKEKNKPYLLFVGDRFGYKNFDNFIKSISRSRLLKNKIKIVCFGIFPFTKQELEFLKNEQINLENITFIKGNDELLKKLYLNSIALVYPSLYEGFGLPIIEAMSLGCPVACSNTSSMKEVGGDAVNYFNPNDIDSMTNSIEEVVFSNEKRNILIERGFLQNKKFTWNKCATETLKVYSSVL